MEYFILSHNEKLSHKPIIQNWYEKINVDDLCREQSYKIGQHNLLYVRPDQGIVFYDMIFSPFFCVSDGCQKVIQVYEYGIKWKQVSLLDRENKNTKQYHIPIMNIYSMKTTDSENEIYELDALQLDLDSKSLFCIDTRVEKKVVIRLDLLESLLRRGAYGFTVKPIKVRGV